MAVNHRAQLKAAIAKAIRENTDPAKPAYEIAADVVLAQGMRRAVWAALSLDQRNALVRQAEQEARRG